MTGRGIARLKSFARQNLPTPIWEALRTVASRRQRLSGTPPSDLPAAALHSPLAAYETPWERMGSLYSDDEVVGSGDFDLIGRIELGLLLAEGLRPTDTLVDFGCGTGRLAAHVIPRLAGGHYIGTDISQSMLDKARLRMARLCPRPPCRVTWLKQTDSRFSLDNQTVDMMCAFSVFTHMEHEDTYRYLKDARRVIRRDGRLVFSCLPMTLRAAREVFLSSARHDVRQRWTATRDVTTSIDLMTMIVRLAGWTPVRWYDGEEPSIPLPDGGERRALGQSVCALAPAPGAEGAAKGG